MIAFGLTVGDNVFLYDAATGGPNPQGGYGLNLFFDTTNTSFNPPRQGAGIAGDLTAAVPAGTSNYFVPLNQRIQAYNASSCNELNFLPDAFTNSLASDTVGGYDVSVAAFSDLGLSGGPSGSLTIRTTPTS